MTPTTELIERVARALYAEQNGGPKGADDVVSRHRDGSVALVCWKVYESAARAAIEAMWEIGPTEAVIAGKTYRLKMTAGGLIEQPAQKPDESLRGLGPYRATNAERDWPKNPRS